MKVKVGYLMYHEKEIEMTPEEYCDLRACMDDPKIFPKFSSDRHIESYDNMNEANKKELWDFWESREKEG